jgi:ADP-heptose:LPS heptosyltransferase/GT2 family glycosyltransferase
VNRQADGGILFGEYELLAQSGLFDADFYIKSNPDLATLNIDPLLHYLERGCRERRDPSARFDTGHYLKLCDALGEAPANPLTHYLTIGMRRGLTPQSGADAVARGQGPRGALSIDIPRIVDGIAVAPARGGLSIVGWAVADGTVGVDIAVDGVRLASARHGLRRPDVAAAHPGWSAALQSGFAVHLPPKALTVGRRQIAVTLRSGDHAVSRVEFWIDVPAAPAASGPCALRRRMRQSEVDLKAETLAALHWQPQFLLLLAVGTGRAEIDAARRTLQSLSRQPYPGWKLWVTPVVASPGKGKGAGAPSSAHLAELVHEFEGLAPHILGVGKKGSPSRPPPQAASPAPCFIMRLEPGDELACDAFLELALTSGLERDADFFYCDDRRPGPEGEDDAYFKPGWSPDLLLATNYVGRAWCAERALVERAGLRLANLADCSDYELTLRLTEAARGIVHVPKLLYQHGGQGAVSAAMERQALREALKRRKLRAQVLDGGLRGHYRIKRHFSAGRVSIIIPTCAAGGFIKRCLQSLRSRTAHRDYEVICIHNIPVSDGASKRWLRQHADGVIESDEPFNWSRYNNVAAAQATGTYLLFLNDDTEIIEPDWLAALVEQAQRAEVGVVGGLLLYADRSVQQAGVMLDAAGNGRHAFRHLADGEAGYFGLARTQRNVISLTGACLMTRRATFAALGGFDESHSVINNDLDYCLRAWRSGLLNVYTPYARLIHHELGSRAVLEERYDAEKFHRQWSAVIAKGDPYFNPNLAHDQDLLGVESEPLETVYSGRPLLARDSVRRILVVKLDHIGDCLTALPAVRRLKGHFPKARIAMLAGRATHPIWNAETSVDEVIEFNFYHPRSGRGKLDVTAEELHALERTLHARHFDVAIDLRKQPDAREILRASGARLLAAFDSQGRFPWLDVALEWDEDVPLRSKHGHVADDLVALVDAVSRQCESGGGPLLQAPKGKLSLPAAEQRRLFSNPVICVHPASGSLMRQWPLPKFADLIGLLLDLQEYHIALIGGPDETDHLETLWALLRRRERVFNLAGRLGLEELPLLLSRAALFVGNNSGPQHLAAGLGIPTIGIHSGVVDAREWGPVGPKAVALRRVMACSPCFLEQPQDCPRGVACLSDLGVSEVYQACRRSLGAGRAR